MKNIIIILLLCLLFAPASHAITDSLISEWAVDGTIVFWDYNNSMSANTVSLTLKVGDGPDLINGGENYTRSYLSFDISGLPESTNVQTAILKVYQSDCTGNDTAYIFPRWTGIPGGDTLYCLLDHVNYGDTLDTLDWSAGDAGDSQTIINRYGVISSTPDTCWKTLDVTSCVKADVLAKRTRSQYRLRFAVNTDFDMRGDALYFRAGNSSVVYQRPRIIFDYTVGVAGEPPVSAINNKIKLTIQPTPFSRQTIIAYNLPCVGTVKLNIYDITGRIVKRLLNGNKEAGQHYHAWDGTNDNYKKVGNGIYYCRLNAFGTTITQKIIKLK